MRGATGRNADLRRKYVWVHLRRKHEGMRDVRDLRGSYRLLHEQRLRVRAEWTGRKLRYVDTRLQLRLSVVDAGMHHERDNGLHPGWRLLHELRLPRDLPGVLCESLLLGRYEPGRSDDPLQGHVRRDWRVSKQKGPDVPDNNWRLRFWQYLRSGRILLRPGL